MADMSAKERISGVRSLLRCGIYPPATIPWNHGGRCFAFSILIELNMDVRLPTYEVAFPYQRGEALCR